MWTRPSDLYQGLSQEIAAVLAENPQTYGMEEILKRITLTADRLAEQHNDLVEAHRVLVGRIENLEERITTPDPPRKGKSSDES